MEQFVVVEQARAAYEQAMRTLAKKVGMWDTGLDEPTAEFKKRILEWESHQDVTRYTLQDIMGR